MASHPFVGRTEALSTLQQCLLGTVRTGKLTIQSIEGPGGIGKSQLFNHALENTNLSERKYLTMRVDANQNSNNSLVDIVSHMVVSAKASTFQEQKSSHYFPTVIKTLSIINQVRDEAVKELLKVEEASKSVRQELPWIVTRILELGKKANEIVPPQALMGIPYAASLPLRINYSAMEKHLPAVLSSIPSLQALNIQKSWLTGLAPELPFRLWPLPHGRDFHPLRTFRPHCHEVCPCRPPCPAGWSQSMRLFLFPTTEADFTSCSAP